MTIFLEHQDGTRERSDNQAAQEINTVSMTTKADSLHETLIASIDALAAETDSAKPAATFRTGLDSMSRFHRYSWGNQIRIAEQRPDATHVAGFHTWLK